MDDDLDAVTLSALQHWAYCPRQCALIHVEQAFDDNLHTLRGNAVHAQVDQPGVEIRSGLRVERALPIWHDALGLAGKADVVEFEPDGTPYPVEYKHGSRHKRADIAACDDVQLAAQALCLESMTGRAVNEGALYYAASKRRRIVAIDSALRQRVAEATAAVRELLRAGRMPPPVAHASIALVLLDQGGRFKARLEGAVGGNVLLRQAQHRSAGDATFTLELTRRIVGGYLHALRPGRAALALDLLEEFRPLADRLALTLVNRQQVGADDFVTREGGAVQLGDAARKAVVVAFQERKQELLSHPLLEQGVALGLVPLVQARLLARHVRGEATMYPPFPMS